MKYSLEDLYIIAGREDKIITLMFSAGSKSHDDFGEWITAVFVYTQKERDLMEAEINNGLISKTYGYIKAKCFTERLSEEKKEQIFIKGILSSDICTASPSTFPSTNTYISEQTRKAQMITIPIEPVKKNGGDLNFMYGFDKNQIMQGIGLPPDEMNFYYAAKLYFEPENITEEEKTNIYVNGEINPAIENELLTIKVVRKEISPDELMRARQLILDRQEKIMSIINLSLNSAGTSLIKLYEGNPDQLYSLWLKAAHFRHKHLNITGKIPIYLDLEGLLHIYLRHVKEFQVTDLFKDKDNFQWDEEDVLHVIRKVIAAVDTEVQNYWVKTPRRRFSKYGIKSFYFEGDYYTFHIEGDGKLSTFHKNKRK